MNRMILAACCCGALAATSVVGQSVECPVVPAAGGVTVDGSVHVFGQLVAGPSLGIEHGAVPCWVDDVMVAPGDMNCDGAVTVGDINPFVLALTDPDGYAALFPDCSILSGDCTGDSQVTVGDINCFVELVTGG